MKKAAGSTSPGRGIAHIAENLYRVKPTGGEIQRLTEAAGQHNVSVSPDGEVLHRYVEQRVYADEGGSLRGRRCEDTHARHEPGV